MDLLGERLKGEKGWFAGFIVASRAGFRCGVCGADEFPLEVDHRWPGRSCTLLGLIARRLQENRRTPPTGRIELS